MKKLRDRKYPTGLQTGTVDKRMRIPLLLQGMRCRAGQRLYWSIRDGRINLSKRARRASRNGRILSSRLCRMHWSLRLIREHRKNRRDYVLPNHRIGRHGPVRRCQRRA
jgi:hypothetical protein